MPADYLGGTICHYSAQLLMMASSLIKNSH